MFGRRNIQTTTDEQLMLLIGKGREDAFGVLYDRYFDKLVWYANGFTGDIEKAKDLVQEVFVKIIEQPAKFDTSRTFSTWVYTVTGNACRNLLRDEQNRSRLLKEHAAGGVTSTVMVNAKTDLRLLQQRIRDLLDELSDKERTVYLLRFEQGLSIKEVAAIAAIPEGSVKSCIYYLLKKFDYHLKEFRNE